jgi:hypothetical protein
MINYGTILLGIVGLVIVILVIRKLNYKESTPREYTEEEKKFIEGRNEYCEYCGRKLKFIFNTGKKFDSETGKPTTKPDRVRIDCSCGRFYKIYIWDGNWELKEKREENTVTTYSWR